MADLEAVLMADPTADAVRVDRAVARRLRPEPKRRPGAADNPPEAGVVAV